MESRFTLKLLYLACYPALSVLFMLLGLPYFLSPLAVIIISVVIPYMTLLVIRIAVKCASWWWATMSWAWLGSLLLLPDIGLTGLGYVVNGFMIFFMSYVLKRIGFLTKLPDMAEKPRKITILWFIYVLSAAVPTSAGLALLTHLVSLVPIIVWSVVFGLFAPEVNSRVNLGGGRALFLIGAYLIMVFAFIGLLQWINPALYTGYWDLIVMIGVGFVAVNSMLMSRCTLEAIQKLINRSI